MITKITDANKALYTDLFNKISKAIGIEINSIEGYFENLAAIAEYVGTHTQVDYFLRLPSDEEVFAINANTRVITVPSVFKSSGIAVVGDCYAETLWFKIDKYYDIQDLGTDDVNIRIYWELPGKVKGYSVPQYKDVWSTPGQVLFGWTIPTLLTENAGTVKISISFFNDTYSFNTLAQDLKIAPALMSPKEAAGNFDEVDRSDVLSRLKNSTASAVAITTPTFAYFDPLTIGANEILDNGATYLRASAYSDRRNDLTIEYTWYKGGHVISSDKYSEAWFESTDTVANPNKKYYASTSDEFYMTDNDAINNKFNTGAKVYEKGSKILVSEIGSYQVKAVARIGSSMSRPEYSNIVWTFEAPRDFNIDDVVFSIEPTDGIIPDGEAAKPQLKIKLPVEMGQQNSATWTTTLLKDGAIIPTANFPYTVTTEGEYSVEVVKTLNKQALPGKTTSVIAAINEAKPVQIELAPGQKGLITIGEDIILTATGIQNDAEHYSYKFILQRTEKKTPTEEDWMVYSERNTLPDSYSLSSPGYYRMKVEAVYKKYNKTSVRVTISDKLVRVVD